MRKIVLIAAIVMFSLALVNCGSVKLTNESAKEIFAKESGKALDEALKAAGDLSDDDRASAKQKLKELIDAIKVTEAKETEDGKSGSAKFQMSENKYMTNPVIHYAKVDGDWKIEKVDNGGEIIPANKYFEKMKSGLARGRIKTTMIDMKSVGMGIESYIMDNEFAPQITSITELPDYLVPFHAREIPTKDAWGNTFHYKANEFGPDQGVYFIGSGGSDGKFDGFDQTGKHSGEKGKDIIYSNGNFVYSPN